MGRGRIRVRKAPGKAPNPVDRRSYRPGSATPHGAFRRLALPPCRPPRAPCPSSDSLLAEPQLAAIQVFSCTATRLRLDRFVLVAAAKVAMDQPIVSRETWMRPQAC